MATKSHKSIITRISEYFGGKTKAHRKATNSRMAARRASGKGSPSKKGASSRSSR